MTTPAEKKRPMLITFILFLAIFTINSGNVVVSPILKFLREGLGFPDDKYGVVLAIYPIVSFFMGIVLGPMADRCNRKKTLLCGLLGLTATSLLTGLAPGLNPWLVFRGLTGAFGVLTAISVFSYIMDYFTGADRAKVMGVAASAIFLAMNLSASAAIVIAGALSWRCVFYSISALSLVILLFTLFFLPSPDVEPSGEPFRLSLYKKRLVSFAGSRTIAVSMLVYLLVSFGGAVLRSIYPTWLFDAFAEQSITYVHVSWLFLIGGAGGIAGSVLSGHLAERVKDKMMYVGGLILLLGLLSPITPFAIHHVHQQFVIVFLLSLISSLHLPVFRTVLIGSVKPNERASMAGLLNSLMQFGTAGGAFAGAGLYVIDDTLRSNGYCAAGMLIYGVVLIWLLLTRKPSPSTAAAERAH